MEKIVDSTMDYSQLMEEYDIDNLIAIDVGANLTNKKYSKDLDSVIQRARDAGVQKLLIPSTSLKSSKEALRLTRLHPNVCYCSVGMHPHDARTFDETTWKELTEVAKAPECVAIGECGLDYNRNFSEQREQKEVFIKQIELACELRKPLYIHERDAQKDLLEILKPYEARGVLPPILVHCFTGTVDEALNYINLGFYIGITGYVCKDKSDTGIRKLLTDGLLPLNQVLLETDSPFMYPNTRASKLPDDIKQAFTERSSTFLQRYCTFQRNEPCSLPIIAEIVATLMKKRPEHVALTTAFNALKVFGLSK